MYMRILNTLPLDKLSTKTVPSAPRRPPSGLTFTRDSFSSKPLYKNQLLFANTPLFCPPPPSSPTLLRKIVFPPRPSLQYLPYNIGNGNIV